MKRHLALVVISVAVVAVETAWLMKRRAEVDAGRARIRELANSIQQQDRTRSELAGSLQALEAEIAAAQSQLVKSPREQAVGDWNRRLDGIKAMFDRDPNQAIPEMQLLTALDWLGLVRTAKLDDEEGRRSILAAIRNAGRKKFAQDFGSALAKYEKDHDWVVPSNAADVAPYMDMPISADVYTRYQVVLPGPVGTNYGGLAAMVESGSPIDEEFDLRTTISPAGPSFSGGSNATASWAAVELRLVTQRAQLEFAKANNRRPTTSADLIPYIDSPVHKALMEAQTAFQKDNGRNASTRADLDKYLPTPESKALAAKLLRR